jgi:hypothetical protein
MWFWIRATGGPSKYSVEHSCFLNAGNIVTKYAVTCTRNTLLFAVDYLDIVSNWQYWERVCLTSSKTAGSPCITNG